MKHYDSIQRIHDDVTCSDKIAELIREFEDILKN